MRSCRHTLTCVVLLAGCSSAAPIADLRPDAGVDLTADQGHDAHADTSAPYCAPALPDAGVARDGCPVAQPPQQDLLDEALAKVKLDRCQVVFSAADKAILPASLWHDPYRLPFFDPVHDAALNAPPFARQVVQALDAAAAAPRPVTAALMVAAHYAGCGGQVCLPSPSPLTSDPLAKAVSRLISGAGGVPDEAALIKEAAGVPIELQRALAPVIDAVAAAALARDEALRDADLGKTATSPGVSLPTLYAYAASLTVRSKSGKALAPTEKWVQNLLQGGANGFRFEVLYHAAVRLAAAVEGADLKRFAGVQATFNAQTPIGRVLIRGPADDTYDPSDPQVGSSLALLLDTGGDDIYRVPAGATSGADNPVSVLVDLGGKDQYGYVEVPSSADGARLVSDADGRAAPSGGNGPVSQSETSRQGAGRLGIGLLFDLGVEDDRYSSLRMSQGFGALGVGVLYDEGGDEIYRAENAAQGSAVFGIGLLLDGGGADVYRSYTQSQGFAYAKAVGLLVDSAGADEYVCDVGDPDQGGDPLYLTPQLSGKGNSSFCQGAGFGRRADTTDQVYMSGGLGVLRDLAGDDRYTSSVFAQATGYWFGTGILADGGGDDLYDGLWYVQGSDAHFALAVFWDQAGDDRYNSRVVPKNTSIGVGHDFSVGWHLDLGGNDSYRAPNLSLGSGNDNGIGVMINLGGDDSYEASGVTLGAAPLAAASVGGARASVITLGVFVDAEGKDTYRIDGALVDRQSSCWTYTPASTGTRQLGVALDGSGTVVLP
jgi:hypothetical protein